MGPTLHKIYLKEVKKLKKNCPIKFVSSLELLGLVMIIEIYTPGETHHHEVVESNFVK